MSNMKRLLILVVLLSLSFSAIAQEFKSVRIGLIEEDGNYSLSFPSSTIVVDIVVEKEVVTPGIYARYAQKYLALRTPLAPKESHRIVSSSINLIESPERISSTVPTPAPTIEEYIALPVDQFSSSVLSADDAAREAANEIFNIRRHRRELVSGDAGEHYFGAGMQTAIETLDKSERELLKLFTGVKEISQTSQQYIVGPQEGVSQYVIARFNPTMGLLSDTDLAGVPIYLQLTPMQTINTESLEAGPKAIDLIWFRIAAPTQCTLYNDSNLLSNAIFSLYEFGKSIKVDVTRKK